MHNFSLIFCKLLNFRLIYLFQNWFSLLNVRNELKDLLSYDKMNTRFAQNTHSTHFVPYNGLIFLCRILYFTLLQLWKTPTLNVLLCFNKLLGIIVHSFWEQLEFRLFYLFQDWFSLLNFRNELCYLNLKWIPDLHKIMIPSISYLIMDWFYFLAFAILFFSTLENCNFKCFLCFNKLSCIISPSFCDFGSY